MNGRQTCTHGRIPSVFPAPFHRSFRNVAPFCGCVCVCAACSPARAFVWGRYMATSCRIESDNLIVCLTGPGAGVGLRVVVGGVGGQQSELSPDDAVISYVAPMIVGFSGNGAHRARPSGSETLFISGKNFGPSDETLGMVSSIDYHGDVRAGVRCNLRVPHTEVMLHMSGLPKNLDS